MDIFNLCRFEINEESNMLPSGDGTLFVKILKQNCFKIMKY
jgi:hypothetical protein